MSQWYPVSAMRILKKPVRVRWGWVPPFEAVLLENKPRRWATLRRDKAGVIQVIWLPRKTQRVWRDTFAGETADVSETWLESRGWGPEPDAWQPVGVWPDPLPDPLPIVVRDWGEARMVSIGKVAFDATAAASEMEADRENARNGLHQEEQEDRRQLAWWRDASRIRYQPRGEISREMAEGRIMRAVSWCGAGHDLSRGGVAMSRFLAEIATMTLTEALAAQEELIERAVRFEPLRQDHDDFLTAMGWFVKLGKIFTRGEQKAWSLHRPQEVLLWRSLTVPLSFADIGRQFGVSGQRARDIYEFTIDRVNRIANASAYVDPVILRLQERNRAARRASANG